MYAYLQGRLEEITADNCIIDVNNIGYNVRISPTTAQSLPSVGSEVRLYTYTSVREDAIQLLGFLSQSDLSMFRKLITVSGIGPKGAMSILSVMNADAVRFAIMTGDVNSLSKAPGVGKRSAERVIIDLKGKLDDLDIVMNGRLGMDAQNTAQGINATGIVKEATEALTALGYGAAEAMEAIRKIEIKEDMEVEEILKLALRELI